MTALSWAPRSQKKPFGDAVDPSLEAAIAPSWRSRPRKASFALTALVTTSTDFLAYVLDQLASLDGVSSRRMFGGVGLYCDELFFALIADDVLYLRVDDSNRADYTARGAAQFRPYADRPHLSLSYYAAPAEVLDDASELVLWARRSVGVAMRVAPAPARKAAAKKRGARKVTPSAHRLRPRR